MPRIRKIKTSFTAGEITDRLLGRSDLAVTANGVRRLRNMQVFPTGGVSRRPGLRFAARAPGTGRLVAFEFNTEQTYLLLFSDRLITVYDRSGPVAALAAPWTADRLRQLAWTQSADTLLLCHPDSPPQKLVRHGAADFRLRAWQFHTENGRIAQPCYKFADGAVTLKPGGVSGVFSLTASADVFLPGHAETRFRIRDREVRILSVSGPRSATAEARQTLADTAATADWTEQAFSAVRGWPVCVCFHQDRLVIGGSRSLPNRIWLSRSGDLFNFETLDGRDDAAIEFPVLSDQVNAVRAVVSGRHLQIFTSGAEWTVSGQPLTPSSVQLRRQTRIGSPVDRIIPPRDVDGATLFISRTGLELREFLFADGEQAYQSVDLALLARHLMQGPLDQDFHAETRILYIVMENGGMAAVTMHRAEQVIAWARFETGGRFLSVCSAGKDVWVLVERGNGVFIERFDPETATDCCLTLATDEGAGPQRRWTGLDHLEGLQVQIVADGIPRGPHSVRDGTLLLATPARRLEAGLAFRHRLTPMPLHHESLPGAGQGVSARLVRVTFRLLETRGLRVDTGKGPKAVPFRRLDRSEILDRPALPFTGDKTVRALGWNRGGVLPPWRVEQEDPLPCTILAVVTEVGMTGF